MKQKLLSQLKMFLHCIFVLILTAISTFVSLTFSCKVSSIRSFLFPTDIYEVFLPTFILGILIFAVGYINIWKRLLLQDLKKNIKFGKKWTILFVVTAIITLVCVFVIAIFILLIEIGLFGTFGEFIDGFIIFYPMIFCLIYSISNLIVMRKKLKKYKRKFKK